MELDSRFILRKFKEGDKEAFDFIFREFYQNLVWFAMEFILDKDKAEELVQGVFVKFWQERESIVIVTSLKAYLNRSVKNKCLDLIKHSKIKKGYEELAPGASKIEWTENDFSTFELRAKIKDAVDLLPEKTRVIFKLSRDENKKYKEISEELNISVKTVEAHMGKALALMRRELNDWL